MVAGREPAQASLEVLLTTGVIVVALIVAVIAGFSSIMPEVVGRVCPLVDTAATPAASPSSPPAPSAPGGCF